MSSHAWHQSELLKIPDLTAIHADTSLKPFCGSQLPWTNSNPWIFLWLTRPPWPSFYLVTSSAHGAPKLASSGSMILLPQFVQLACTFPRLVQVSTSEDTWPLTQTALQVIVNDQRVTHLALFAFPVCFFAHRLSFSVSKSSMTDCSLSKFFEKLV